jgi:hypothetical protein
MNVRRRTSRFDASTPAITPVIPAVGTQTREEMAANIFSLKKLLTAERQRNARIEVILCKQLDTLQASLEAIREAYFLQLAPKPTGTKQ